MSRQLFYILVYAVMAPAWSSHGQDAPDYFRDVQPTLAEYCYPCHGPDEKTRKADLRFDVMDVAIELIAITPGDSTDSFLVDRIYSDDPDEIMPPPESKKELTDAQKQLLVDWIDAGADHQPHWSFQPVANPAIPEPKDTSGWVSDPIDAFVLHRFDTEKLKPSPQADSETLLRRLYFDLTGLPPTVDETQAFLQDPSLKAYEELVDDLLASPAYGEHMAGLWLDLARYADTYGYQSDVENRVWPWRDWVIRAFNNNLPYDDFITQQLAGDLLPDPTQDQVLATAFNRLHRQTNEGGSIEEEFRVEYAADRTETMGTAFMGLTLECARCHDHKFDPISQREYYQLFSFFNNIDESGMYSHFTDAIPPPARFLFEGDQESTLDRLMREVAESEDRLAQEQAKTDKRFRKWSKSKKSSTPPLEPVVHLTFDDEPEDGKIVNQADGKDSARVSNEYTLVDGADGQALRFDGETSISMNDTARFDRYQPFSMAFSINIAEYAPHRIVAHRSQAEIDAASRGHEILLSNGHVVFSLNHFWPGNAIRVKTTEALPLNTWSHVAVTYDGSSRADGVHIYFNGQEVALDVIRDKLNKTLLYERKGMNPPFQLGTRFRDVGLKHAALDDFQIYDIDLTALEAQAVAAGQDVAVTVDAIRAADPTSPELHAHFTRRIDAKSATRQDDLDEQRKALADHIDSIRQIMVMKDMSELRTAYLLERGEYSRKKEQVSTDTPAIFPPLPKDAPKNRLTLAQWLTNPDHPMTARVAVNRFWQQFFGRGIVDTPEDFGIQGGAPSHPELLDHLAHTFVDSGWDVKAMVRRIVLSSTYRQSSDASPDLLNRDPDNTLLARGPHYRRSAEEIRDAALAASGLLVPTIGGPSVKPYQPDGLWIDSSSTKYKRDTGDALYRRTMYTFLKRTVPPPSLMTFDATAREVCVARRESTQTPLQSLVLLNDPQFVEASRVLAERALQGNDTPDAAIEYLFRALLTRGPNSAERDILTKAYNEQRAWFGEHADEAKAYMEVGDWPVGDSVDPEDLAAMTAVAQAVMNHHEFQMKR